MSYHESICPKLTRQATISMLKSMREIEIKLRANDLEALAQALTERGCSLSELISQHDTIYSKSGSAAEFTEAREGDIILRIRRLSNRAEFTLKQQRSSEMDNIEYETKIADPEILHQMLLTLGWKPVVEVKKLRRKCKLGECEICLDQVEHLGFFAEFEKLIADDDDTDPESVRNELFTIAETLGLSRNDEEIQGYDTQIYQSRNK